MNNKLVSIVAIILLMVVGSHARAAVVLNIDSNGQLTEASNVVVNGSLFTVLFVDGSCTNLFNGCDSASDFVFQTA